MKTKIVIVYSEQFDRIKPLKISGNMHLIITCVINIHFRVENIKITHSNIMLNMNFYNLHEKANLPFRSIYLPYNMNSVSQTLETAISCIQTT